MLEMDESELAPYTFDYTLRAEEARDYAEKVAMYWSVICKNQLLNCICIPDKFVQNERPPFPSYNEFLLTCPCSDNPNKLCLNVSSKLAPEFTNYRGSLTICVKGAFYGV